MPFVFRDGILSTPSLFSPLFYYIIEVVVFNARGQLSALCLPFERVDGAVEGPADRSISGSVGVGAQDGVLSKAAWGGAGDGGCGKQWAEGRGNAPGRT